jgi:hypothetical protein
MLRHVHRREAAISAVEHVLAPRHPGASRQQRLDIGELNANNNFRELYTGGTTSSSLGMLMKTPHASST